MTFEDLIANIGFVRYHICFETKNPFYRNELSERMASYGIKYFDGYMEMDGIYSYAVISVKGGKKRLMEFLAWFKQAHEWKYHYTRHGLFRTRITCLCWDE